MLSRLETLPTASTWARSCAISACSFQEHSRRGRLFRHRESGARGGGARRLRRLRGPGRSGADAGGIAGDLELVGSGDDDDAIKAATPIGKDTILFAAGAGIALHFEDQRGLDYGYGGGIARKDVIHPSLLGAMTAGWTMAFSSLRRPPWKANSARRARFRRPSGLTTSGPNARTISCIDLLAGLHQLAAQLIGFDDLGAQFAQVARDGALAAAQTAGESYSQHDLENSQASLLLYIGIPSGVKTRTLQDDSPTLVLSSQRCYWTKPSRSSYCRDGLRAGYIPLAYSNPRAYLHTFLQMWSCRELCIR